MQGVPESPTLAMALLIPGECTEQLGVQGPTASRRDVSKRPSERLLEPRIERQRRDATIRSSEARCDVGRQPSLTSSVNCSGSFV